MRILVIEDEQKVARFLKKGLETEKYDVDVAYDGKTGEKLARTEMYDIILLDILLPKKDGFQILQDLRKDEIRTPIIVLTAKTSTEDIVTGLDKGADDYICKPFEFKELLARIRCLLRREKSKTRLKYADLILDTVSRKATRANKTIELSSREYSLLKYFMQNNNRIVTRNELAKEVWGFDFDPGTNVVDVYVNLLRKKIDHGLGTKLIHTERGKGYYLSNKDLYKHKKKKSKAI